MSLYKSQSDIAFSADDAHRFLPWIVSIMTCLATLLLFLGLTVGSWIHDHRLALSHSFTVNIPAATDNLPAKADAATDALKQIPGVARVSAVSESQLKSMLAPWIGDGDAVSDLPLPAVLEVTTDDTFKADTQLLEDKLAAVAPNIKVDTQERWVESFAHFSNAMQWLMAILAAFIIVGLALIMAFTSRAALKLHARTVQLLHSIGAEDEYIARQFQHEAFLITLRGTVPGCTVACLIYWVAGIYLASLGATMLPDLSITPSHIALLLTMPLGCGAVAYAAARVSLLQQLRHTL